MQDEGDQNMNPGLGEVSARNFRWWIPILLLTLCSGWIYYLHVQESMMARVMTVLALVPLGLLLWLWWTFMSGHDRSEKWKSFLSGVVAISALVLFFMFAVRYEGSTDGAALPKFAWKWSPTTGERSASLEIAESNLPKQNASDINIKIPGLFSPSPQYLGQNGNGIISGVTLNTDFTSNPPEQLWKQPIGEGWSGFSLVDFRAVTQEQRGQDELVTCYNLLDGSLLWYHADEARFEESMGGDGPRATPAIAGTTVYTMGATGIVNALNLSDGSLIWTRNIMEGASPLIWGKSSSPLILAEENLLIVTGGNSGGATVYALNLSTGDIVWQFGNGPASYATPVTAEVLDERLIVSVNENEVVGLMPATGKSVFVVDWPVGMMPSTAKSAQPHIIDGDKLFISASYGIGSLMARLVRNPEVGSISSETLWHAKTRMKTKFSSTVILDEHAYGLDEGVLACSRLDDGRRVWKGGRYGFGQQLLVGDTLLVQAEDGRIVLVEATPDDFRELTSFQGLDDKTKTWTVPTLAGQYLLIRNDREAACYRLPVQD